MARLVLLSLLWLCSMGGVPAVTFDGAATNQVVDGFGVNVNFRSWNGAELQPVLDAFIDQAGMTLFRVAHDLSNWESSNDDTNADSINWDFFNSVFETGEFPKLWALLGYLNSRGITNGAYPCFMGWGPSWMMDVDGQTLKAGMEEEWAETMTAALVYARSTRGLHFGLVGPNNEPELTSEGIHMNVAVYTNALHRLALKLAANGLGDLRFVAPDTVLDTNYLPAILADPLIMAKVGHVGLHSYSGAGDESRGINDLLRGAGYADLNFWMTEFNVWCSTCDSGTRGTYDWTYCEGTADYLLRHLLNGASGGIVWEGYDSVYAHHGYVWSYWGLFSVDDISASSKTYTPRKHFYTLTQISKWVRPGAQRISISGDTSPFSPLVAFKHPISGQVTIVGINTSSSAATLGGSLVSLPAVPRLDLFYTSANTNLAAGDPVSVSDGTFSALIPADCVFTLTGSPAGPRGAISSPSSGTSFAAPATIPIEVTAAGDISQVRFYSGTTELGQATNAPYSLIWSNVPMGDYALTARIFDTDGNTITSAVVNVMVVGPLARIYLSPSNATVAVGSGQQFLARGTDLLGHALGVQPSFAWSVTGGGAIDTNGLFNADGPPGHLVYVSATSGGVAGFAAIIVFGPGGYFGNTNDGSLTDSLWSKGALIHASRFLAIGNWSAGMLHAKVGAISGRYKCAIYADSAGMPGPLLKATAEVSNPSAGWQAFPIVSPLEITNGRYYWLAIWSDSSSARIYYDGTQGTLRSGLYNYGPWPTPITTTGGSSANHCIYAAGADSVLTSIALIPVSLALFPSETLSLAALGIYPNGATTNLTAQATWLSANPLIASVSAEGLVTGKSPGSTTISASWAGLAGSAALTALPPPLIESLSLADDKATVRWITVPNRAYRLQYLDDLSSTNWVDLLPDVLAEGTAAMGTNILGPQAIRFYRVLVLP